MFSVLETTFIKLQRRIKEGVYVGRENLVSHEIRAREVKTLDS